MNQSDEDEVAELRLHLELAGELYAAAISEAHAVIAVETRRAEAAEKRVKELEHYIMMTTGVVMDDIGWTAKP